MHPINSFFTDTSAQNLKDLRDLPPLNANYIGSKVTVADPLVNFRSLGGFLTFTQKNQYQLVQTLSETNFQFKNEKTIYP